jgi:Endonuclease-reverse transcriptase
MVERLNHTKTSICIRQQNLNKSSTAHWDLINSKIHDDCDLLLLQEPYIDGYGNTKSNRHWHVIYPSSRSTDNSPVQAVILVNIKLLTNQWTQLDIPDNNDITGIQIHGLFGTLSIINIYNDCNHARNIMTSDNILARIVDDPNPINENFIIWAGDFNRHHPLWDEEHNRHLFTTRNITEAELLIETLTNHDLEMALPKGLPTLQSMVTKNWTRTDNVFCSQNVMEILTTCTTLPEERPAGTDHLPVVTLGAKKPLYDVQIH